jgi:hypothetical protein
METTTGETGEIKLDHASGEATRFYRQLPGHALIGMESTGNCQWFVEMAAAAGHDLWIGDAAKIRACEVRAQKHDRRDAALILKLLLEGRFPRIWIPSREEKDLRQLLIHRYKLVRIRAQVKNGLQHLAMNQGVLRKQRLWSKAGQKMLCELPLAPWASRRREPHCTSSPATCLREPEHGWSTPFSTRRSSVRLHSSEQENRRPVLVACGVLFGLELALLETRKLGTSPETTPASSSEMYEAISKLIFDRLDQLITLCQAPIKRDLLVYNAQLARYELLRSVRQQAAISGPNDYEIQAHSDFE